ncbi:unnamed protein product [Adineta ricciae]|uniref:Uncharacterized protein n=1 Tax=Adineta ricciae TaxID=249248 RepID=A0A813U9Q4_ADIRI|nr:unnamed protein product [Adineta ricciae]
MTSNKVFVIWITLYSSLINGSHFRGGTMSWRPVSKTPLGNMVTIQIRQRWSWRLSAVACNQAIIAQQYPIGDPSVLYCTSGNCNFWRVPVTTQTYCIDFNTGIDVSYGEKYDRVSLPVGVQFSIAFSSCCWFASLVAGANSPWSVVTRISTIRRPDGYINSSPSAAVMPIVYKEVGVKHVYVVQMTDNDGSDVLKCRWASRRNNMNSYDECGGVCFGVPGAILIEDNCTIIFTLTKIRIYVAVALQIEDYYDKTSMTPMSSTPVQFLFYSYQPSSVCTTPPKVYSGRSNYDCVSASVGSMVTKDILVNIGCVNKTIIDFITSIPTGMTKGPIRNRTASVFSMTLSWTPTDNQRGPQSCCIVAVDNTHIQSNQLCITYLVDPDAPRFVGSSAWPVGTIYENQTIFSIESTKPIRRPSRVQNSVIRFYDAQSNSLVKSFDCVTSSQVTYSNTKITIDFQTAPWTRGHSYYVTLDEGVAVMAGASSCSPPSAPITSSKFWTFYIWDPSVTEEPVENNTSTTDISTVHEDDAIVTTGAMETLAPLSCHSHNIALDPQGSSLTNPLDYLYNEDIYIDSNVTLQCDRNVRTTSKWTIISHSSNQLEQTPLIFSFELATKQLLIPAFSLYNGIYELKFILTVIDVRTWISSSSAYIRISRADLVTNLVLTTATNVTHNYEKALELNPGKYSIDLKPIEFHPKDWNYTYYCRIYSKFARPQYQSFEDRNNACFSLNPLNFLKYNDTFHTAVTILPRTLVLHQSYQFMVRMTHRENSSLQSVGYAIIHIERIQSPIVIISCVVSTVCSLNLQYYYVNPSTQLALWSFASDNQTLITSIE